MRGVALDFEGVRAGRKVGAQTMGCLWVYSQRKFFNLWSWKKTFPAFSAGHLQ